MSEPITNKQKLAEVRREIGMRRKVYPRSSMAPHEQAQRIAVMEAIEADYEVAIANDAGPLFGGGQ